MVVVVGTKVKLTARHWMAQALGGLDKLPESLRGTLTVHEIDPASELLILTDVDGAQVLSARDGVERVS
jgi:hypothetical protein